MVVRDKTGLQAQITTLLASAQADRIQASELRSVLQDFIDSLDLMVSAEGQSLVDRIDDAIGNTSWQAPGAGGTGITLAQALAGIRIDGTPVDHIRLTLDTSNPARVTIGLESVAVHTQTRYAAYRIADRMFTESDWLNNSNTSTTSLITFPQTTANHYKGFAIPASEASLTSIQQVGNPFDERSNFLPAVGDADVLVDIGGESHKTYIGQSQDFGGFAVDYELR